MTKLHLRDLVNRAWAKLRGEPIHIPNAEHRQLHLTIFGRLNNPFVHGLLVAYWDAYDASELTRFQSYQYWTDVWSYHQQIVDALCANDFECGSAVVERALCPAANRSRGRVGCSIERDSPVNAPVTERERARFWRIALHYKRANHEEPERRVRQPNKYDTLI
jgi:hypothetical protein